MHRNIFSTGNVKSALLSREKMKILIRIIVAGVVVLMIGVAAVLGPYALRVQHFSADPANGYHADFYLYVSPNAKRAARNGQMVTLLIQPNNSGTSSDDAEVHRKDAWWTGFERRKIADELGVILLVPAFIRPGEDWHIYTHALDRDTLLTERTDLKRIDLQLLAMIDNTRIELAKAGIQTDQKIFIQGFSASGMFANRFTILHPERVKAATIGSPGGWPTVPIASFKGEQLPYPAGIADLESLTGVPYDSAAYNAIPQLIYMGSLDDNDSLDHTDGWDEKDAIQVDKLFGDTPLSRWDDIESIYQKAGANVQFLLIEGVGHDRQELQKYSTEFFEKVLNDK
jgi:poly(3-hydroxybutyrate) depolymerase